MNGGTHNRSSNLTGNSMSGGRLAEVPGVRPRARGCVIGLGLGQYRFVGGGVSVLAIAGLSLMLMPEVASAGPENPTVAAGTATFNQKGNNTVIRASNGAIIDYSRFDINANERVRFIQPGSDARVLNRINSDAPTRIDGSLRANGVVYFINPAGVMFGQGAVVNAGQIYAAAGTISNADFLNGVNRFTDLKGQVVNHGSISGDVVALVGAQIVNAGMITADKGVIAMVSGEDVVLSKRGDPTSVRVSAQNVRSGQAGQAGVVNTGSVRARGGRARVAAGDMYSLAIRQDSTGTIEARDVKIDGAGEVRIAGRVLAVDQKVVAGGTAGGRVQVLGERVGLDGASIDASGAQGGGTVYVGGGVQGQGATRNSQGTIVTTDSSIRADATQSGNGGTIAVWSDGHTGFYGQASAQGGTQSGDGGFVETSGKQTLDVRSAKVDVSAGKGRGGQWLLDPSNVTITTAGGGVDDLSGSTYNPPADGSQVSVSSILTALNSPGATVTITTVNAGGTEPGNITVAAPINRNSTNNATLVLQADNNIVVNQTIDSTGGAGRLNVNLQAAGTIAINAPVATNGGTFTSVSGAAFAAASGVTTTSAGGNGEVSVTATDVSFSGGGGFDAGSASIALIPTAGVTNVNVNSGASGFSILSGDLNRLLTTGLVSIGATGGTQTVTVNSTGPLNLSGTPSLYDLEVRGAAITVDNNLTLGTNKSFTARAAGANTVTINRDLIASGGISIFADADIITTSNTSINAGSANIVIAPTLGGTAINLNTTDTTSGLNLAQEDLSRINTTGTLTIGASGLGNTVNANTRGGTIATNLGSRGYNLTIIGGPITIGGTTQLTAPGGRTLSLQGSGDVAINAPITGGGSAFNLAITHTGGGGGVTIANTIDANTGTFNSSGFNFTLNSIGANFIRADGGITLDHTGVIQLERPVTTNTGTGSILVRGSDLQLGALGAISSGGAVEIRPASGVTQMFINGTGAGYSVSTQDLDKIGLPTGALLTFGRSSGALAINLGNQGPLSLPSNNVVINGGALTFANGYTGGNGRSLTLNVASIASAGTSTPDVAFTGGVGSLTLNVSGNAGLRLAASNLVTSVVNGNFDLVTAGAFVLPTLSVGGNLNLSAGDTITQTGAIAVLGTSTLRTLNDSGAAIALTNAGNALTGAVTLLARNTGGSADAAGALALTNTLATALGGLQSTSTADVRSGGAISQTGPAIVGGASSFRTLNNTPAAISLTNAGNTFGGAVSATTRNAADSAVVAGPISINSTGPIDLGSIATGSTLGVDSTGAITDSGTLLIGGNANFTTRNNAGAAITLDSLASTFGGSVTANVTNAAASAPTSAAIVLNSTAPLTIDRVVTGGDASIISGGDVQVLNNITAGGVANITSGADFTLPASAYVVSGGRTVVTAANVIFNISSSFIQAGGDIVLQPTSDSSSIAINDGAGSFSLSLPELQRMFTSQRVVIGRSGGTGTVNLAGAGPLLLGTKGFGLFIRGGDVRINQGITLTDNTSFQVVSTGSITRPTTDPSDIIIGGTSGRVCAIAAGSVDLSLNAAQVAANAGNGPLTLTNLGTSTLSVLNLSIADPLGGAAADVTGLSTASSGGGNISLTSAGAIDLQSTTTTPGLVTISAGGNITATGDAASLIAARDLSISTTTGSIGGANTVQTRLGNSANAGILIASAPGGLNITNGLGGQSDLQQVRLSSSAGLVRLNTSGAIVNMGSDWTGVGFDVTSGTFTFLDRNVTSTAATSFTACGVFAVGNSATLNASGQSLSIRTNDLDLAARTDMSPSLSAGSISIGAPALADCATAARTISLGNAVGGLTISNAELALMSTSDITIGTIETQLITVDGLGGSTGAAPFAYTLVSGDAAGRIVFSGAGTSVQSMDARAANGIDVNTNLSTTSTTTGLLTLNGDSDSVASMSSPSDRINIAGGATLAAGTQLVLRAATGGIVGNGAATLTGNSGVSILNNYTNTLGDTTINADRDASGSGQFVLASGTTLTTVPTTGTSRDVLITAASTDIQGRIEAGTGKVGIFRSTAGQVWLGDPTGAPGSAMVIDSNQLNNIAGGSFDVGNASTTLITVNGLRNNATGGTALDRMRVSGRISMTSDDIVITPSALDAGGANLTLSRGTSGSMWIGDVAAAPSGAYQLDNNELARIVSTGLTLQNINPSSSADNVARNIVFRDVATASLAGITGTTTATAGNRINVLNTSPTSTDRFTFSGLSLLANNGVDVRADLTTTTGDLTINGDANSAADTQDGITFGAGRTLTSGRNLTITGGAATGDGALTLSANGDVGIQSNLTTAGATSITADSDATGGGTFSVASTRNVSTGGAALIVRAADVQLDGGLDSGVGISTIERSAGGTINVGAFTNPSTPVTDSTSPMIIANAELARVVASRLILGGTNTSLVQAQGVTNSPAGIVDLRALASGGRVAFSTAASSFNGLASNATDRISVGSNLTAGTGGMSFNRQVELTGNVTLTSGGAVTFDQAVNSDSTARSLTVVTTNNSNTTFSGGIGTTNRLFTLTTDTARVTDGITRVNGDVRTTGSIAFNDGLEMLSSASVESAGGNGIRFGQNSKVRGTIRTTGSLGEIKFRDAAELTGDVLVEASGGGKIGFLGNVFSTGGQHSLTANVSRSVSDSPVTGTGGTNGLPRVIPTITFGRSVGRNLTNGVAKLGNLTLNTAGTRPQAVRQATIIGTADTLFDLTGDFTVGIGERLTSLGALTINATNVTIGDLSSLRDMIVNASNSITLLPRARQSLLTFDFVANGRRLFTGTDGAGDDGLDFVSVDGTIAFSRAPTPNSTSGVWTSSTPRPQFATATGNVGLVSLAGSERTLDGFGLLQFDRLGSVQQAGGGSAILRFAEGTGTAARSFTLDLKASGPSAVDPATGVAKAIPRDSRINAVGREPSVDPSTRDELRQINLDPRDPTAQEFAELLRGSATYDDSSKPALRIVASDNLSVVVNRLPRVQTQDFVAELKSVVGQNRDKQIRTAMTDSVKRFREVNKKIKDIDPLAFRAFIDQNESEAITRGYVIEIGVLFDRLHSLGLTPGEERRVRSNVLLRVKPASGLDKPGVFEQVFRTDVTAMAR